MGVFKHLICFLICITCFIQVGKAEDTLSPNVVHSPTKATIYSLVLPGLGQGYNQKYWKIPVVYASLGAAGYSFYRYRFLMNEKNTIFKQFYANGSEPTAQDIEKRDDYRVNRDFSGIAFVLVYVLQIVDATVDAHFYKFDINQNLGIGLSPQPNELFKLTYTFK
jgi:hypothetical protein